MSKITNNGLSRSGTECFIAVLYPYGNSGHQRVNWEKSNKICWNVFNSSGRDGFMSLKGLRRLHVGYEM